MSYMHIDNLYKNPEIMQFKECYALEKIHGTSAHIGWDGTEIRYFQGGGNRDTFLKLFNPQELMARFIEVGADNITVFGEFYGGKLQGMGETYGKEQRFVVFEVKIGESWLSVPQAEGIARQLGLEFVFYRLIPCTIEAIDAERDAPSEQAKRNGCGDQKMREGIVLRPLQEVRKNNRERIIAKHKRAEFAETKTPRKVGDALEKLKIAEKIRDEWVTEMRLTHVLDAFPNPDITQTGEIIKAMCEDIKREAKDEVEFTSEAWKAINRQTALMFKKRLQQQLREA